MVRVARAIGLGILTLWVVARLDFVVRLMLRGLGLHAQGAIFLRYDDQIAFEFGLWYGVVVLCVSLFFWRRRAIFIAALVPGTVRLVQALTASAEAVDQFRGNLPAEKVGELAMHRYIVLGIYLCETLVFAWIIAFGLTKLIEAAPKLFWAIVDASGPEVGDERPSHK